MPSFRFKAVSNAGKLIQGEFEAENKKAAKALLEKQGRQRGFKVQTVEQRSVFKYKVEKDGKPLQGEQEAYSKEELERALTKLGYKIKRIDRNVIEFKSGVPMTEVVNFIRLSSDLLRQKMNFDEILNLLYEDTANKGMKDVIKTIQKDLKDGKEGTEVYAKHEKVFGKFACYMLGVASTSGNMGLVFESTAKFLERDAQFKKNLRQTLMMPAITVIAVIGVVLFYVAYIFPSTAELFVKMKVTLPPMTAATLDLSYFLKANWWWMLALFMAPFIAIGFYASTPKGRLAKDRIMIKIPVVGDLMHKTSIEIFARVFYTLYSGSGQNVEVIKVAAEACRNSYMEKQIKDIAIRGMLNDGKGLMESLESCGVFTQTALSRFRLGAESGTLRDNAKQLAEYYEVQTTYKMQTVIDVINLFVNMFIMVALIGITIVSSETAIIKPGT